MAQTAEQKAAAKAKKAAEATEAETARRALLTDEERQAEDDAKAAGEATKTDSKTSVIVAWNGGTREFSKEVHGADVQRQLQMPVATIRFAG